MELLGVHHISLNVCELDAAVEFYGERLGLEPLARPDLGFPGAWFVLADGRQLHLVETVDGEPAPGQHFAFRVTNIKRARKELRGRGVRLSKIIQLPDGASQCFFLDPSKNLLELNQPAAGRARAAPRP